jgi:hypothetical protein
VFRRTIASFSTSRMVVFLLSAVCIPNYCPAARRHLSGFSPTRLG